MKSFFKNLSQLCCVFLLYFSSTQTVFSEIIAPDVLVRQVTEEVLNIIRNDNSIQQGDGNKLNQLIEARVLPHFDFNRMTALAMGRDWRKTSQAQQDKLVAEFKTLLVHTYSNALVTYQDQNVDYRPFKMKEGAKEVIVRTKVKQSGAQPVDLDYSLELKDSDWKVYDVVVGGISLVTNYRDTFNQKVRSDGIDGLIAWLTEKNKSNQAIKTKS